MALKFRRGTAAQKSGSLAFGEPYVNTTLGTLQVGLDTGDVTLTSVGATTQFEIQSVSASAFVSASSIYSTNGITGSIAATNGVISGSSQLNNASIQNLTVINLTTVNETASVLFSSGSNRFGDFGNDTHQFTGSVQISGSIATIGTSTATSFNGAINATNGIVSGSSQVSYTGLNNIPSGIISSSAQIDTIFNIDGLVSGSTQITPLLPTGTVSGSSQISYVGLSNVPSGIISSSAQIDTLFNIDGLVSGSSQIDATSTTNWSTGIKTQLDSNTVISGSSQITYTSVSSIPSGIVSGSSQVTPLLPSGIVSGSSQITYVNINSIPSGIVSGSSQIVGSSIGTNTISLNGTSVALGGTATIPNLVSGSSQISYLSVSSIPSGIVSGSSQVTFSGISSLPTLVSGSSQITYANVSSIPAGIVSGSSQVTLSSTTGYGSVLNQAVLTSSSPTFAGLTINGAITATGDITAFFTSDKRHKNNIQIIPNALEKVLKLNGVTWEWNDDVHEVTKSTPKTGLIAQEVQEVLPEVVKTRDDGFLALDYSKMMGLMVEAIKEQQTQIHSLTLEIEKLKEPKGL
jgi:hypothetical protein